MTTAALLRGLLLASAALTAPSALAATSNETPAPVQGAQPDEAAQQQVGEIVVTAQRRTEAAKDVPVAVTAIGGEKLDVLNSSGLDIRFLSARTPSLQIESSFGRTFPRFYIRGLGNTDFDPNAAQPVSVVYDNVALENPMLKAFPAFDLARVEVLRGPQGTLFGRNTPAGVVKLESQRPTDKYEAQGSVSWATYNTINADLALNAPLGGGFSLRVSGLVQHRDNWVVNDTTSKVSVANRKLEGYTDRAGRVQLAYASGDFNALINVHGRDLEGTPRVFRAGLFQQGSNNFSAGFDPKHVRLDGYTSQWMEQWGGSLQLDYHFDGIGTLYSITAYERAKVQSTGDVDGGDTYGAAVPALYNAAFPSNTGGITQPKEFSQELRFATDQFGAFRGQAGLYYFDQNLDYSEYGYNPGGGAQNQNIGHVNINENFGVFASGEFKATDALTLRAGVRYSHDRKNDVITGFGPLTGGLTLPLQTKVKGEAVTWDASATYALTPDVNVYARFATGYLGPAIQDRVTFDSVPTTAGKQFTKSAEAGIKGALPAQGLNYALTGYWFRTDDLQLTAVGGANNSTRLLSADHVNGYGVEAEFSYRPVRGLDLTASGSYNFTQIRDPKLVVAACGSKLCTVTDPTFTVGTSTFARIDGNRLPQAPRFVLNATARYAVPLANGGEVYAYTDWAYRSEINYFLYEAKEFRGRSLVEGGVRIGYRAPEGYEVAAFARNILNQIRAQSAIDFNNLTGMINEPRIIGGEIRFHF
ncbi:TonB-dependent receptor [Sphingomonas sp.]|uniref:TonB-dependent receptor n=1 Tax=Sphingomonas sp. TaxID=28214 RepID=UPI002FD97048